MINAEVIGGVLLPGLIVMVMLLWPFIERSVIPIHYMQQARDAATRVAIGVAVLVMLIVLSLAGYEDELNLPLGVFRWGGLILPILSGGGTYMVLRIKQRLRPL